MFLFLRSICNMQCLRIKLNSAAVNDISGQRSGSMRTPYNSIIRIAGVCGRQDNSLSLCPFLSPWNQTFPVPKKFLCLSGCVDPSLSILTEKEVERLWGKKKKSFGRRVVTGDQSRDRQHPVCPQQVKNSFLFF